LVLLQREPWAWRPELQVSVLRRLQVSLGVSPQVPLLALLAVLKPELLSAWLRLWR
jgi:hypothetical protein